MGNSGIRGSCNYITYSNHLIMNVTCTSETCDYVLNAKCVFYEGVALPYAGISTNDSLETALQKLNTTIQNIEGGGGDAIWGSITGLLGNQTDLITYINNYTPINRTLTINGVTYDLSGNRTWTIPTETFASNVTFVLNSGDTFGKYSNGETAAWAGLTAVQAILDAAIDYISPVFTSFSISGQSTTVEVGTILPTPATFTWAITANSGVVLTLDIKDVTGATTLVANTTNDGSQSGVALGAIQLNSNGVVRQYKGTLHDTGTSPSDIDSSLFTITARYYRWWAPVAATPANSAAVRALAGQAFNTSGNSFTLATGTTLIKFSVNLPPGVTIVSAIDTSNFDVDLTANFVLLGTVNVTDAGGTTRAYNQYEYNVAVPYSSSANIVITTS